MRIGGIGASGGLDRVTGRALEPVSRPQHAGEEPRGAPFRDGSARFEAGKAGEAAAGAATRWQSVLLAQMIGGAGRPEAPQRRRPAPGEAGRAYDDAMRRPYRLEPGTVFARSV